MLFLGIDLAWSPKNNSAITLIKGDGNKGKITDYFEEVGDNEDILNKVRNLVGKKKAFIGIDAPIIVPNEKGSRPAEKITNKFFRKYEAGTHPANRSHLKKYGGLRGERLLQKLEKIGFEKDPTIEPKTEKRVAIEVFPHPATIVLFNLNKTLKYKPRKNRNYKFRWREFERLQECLKDLENKEPPLKYDKALDKKIKGVKGQKLKKYEDLLDSILCAYVVYYYWYWGREKCAILGNLEEGYILTPVKKSMRESLNRKQLSLNEI